ncbi:alpha/beta fold hydrolase [Streptomyces sp. NPDC059868]|uniref:alpha/beta fold hydrolase n=1 Tax=unclassified Streptomyces TaxID=2593676 RepID=UPI000A91A9D0
MGEQDKFHESFAQDLPEDEALVMAVTQKAPPASTFGDSVTAPAWRAKPAWYQVSTADRMIHPDDQRRMAQRMNARKVVDLDAGHALGLAAATNHRPHRRGRERRLVRNRGRCLDLGGPCHYFAVDVDP